MQQRNRGDEISIERLHFKGLCRAAGERDFPFFVIIDIFTMYLYKFLKLYIYDKLYVFARQLDDKGTIFL